jgi:hypothetical protein
MGGESKQEHLMTNFGWSLVEATAQLLDGEEREAVLGDLLEAGENAFQALLDITGLIFRLQAELWRSWRPWLAAFGVSLPASLFLMGSSLSVSQSFERFSGWKILDGAGMAVGSPLLSLMCQALLLIGWSWTAGYVVGSLSRRTVWMSAVLCCSPCFFCLARFRVPSLSRLCLLLFLVPAILGVGQGLRVTRLRLSSAIAIASAITLLMIPTWTSEGQSWWSPHPWLLDATLIWPAWYIVATAWATNRMHPEEVTT